MNKNDKCLLLSVVLLNFVNSYAMFDGLKPVDKHKKDNIKSKVYKDHSSDEDNNSQADVQPNLTTVDLGNINLDTTAAQVKHDPLTWATLFRDYQRGRIDNILHELKQKTFDEKALANVERVNAAIEEGIKYEKTDDLGHLVMELKNINFEIQQMPILKLQKFFYDAMIKKQDKFILQMKDQIAKNDENLKHEYDLIVKSIAPIIAVYQQKTNKQLTDIKNNVSNMTSELNFVKVALAKISQMACSENTEDSLLQITKTEGLVNDSLKTREVTLQRLENITSALHGLLLIETNI